MRVLKASDYQKRKLQGEQREGFKINFVKDADGNWIIGKGILENPAFADLRSSLERLNEIEHNPIIEDGQL